MVCVAVSGNFSPDSPDCDYDKVTFADEHITNDSDAKRDYLLA